jgi:predicted permease
VEAAGISDNLPLSRNRSWGFGVKGQSFSDAQAPSALVYIVSPGYLNAMGMRLREGRDVGWDDGPKSAKVVIINEAMARRFWPGLDPIGRIIYLNGETRVIGVTDDVRGISVEERADLEIYLPVTQSGPEGAQLVVRSKLPPATLAPSVMATLREMNPGQSATEFRPVQQLVDHSTSPRRFFVLLVGIFAGLGLLLASLGIYGVIAYSVTQRTQEIGIRMALGASRGRVQRGEMAKTLWLVLAGMVVGTLGSFAASRAIASLLFGTQPTDLVTYAGMVLVLMVVALVAGYLPARRASRIDPMIALRTN